MALGIDTNDQRSSDGQTQNPQTVGQSSSINGSTNNTQQTPASSSLDNTSSSVGIPLVNTQPLVVPVGSTTTALTHSVSSQPVKTHKANVYAISIVAILLIAAVLISIYINRAAKTTTN